MKSFLLILGIAVVILFSSASTADAQDATAVIRFEPESLDVGLGQVEKLDIVIEDAKDVYGIDVRAEFDPNVIEIADADEEREGIQLIPGDFIKPDFLVRNTADNEQGTWQYVTTQTNPTPPASGTGIVLSILVRGKAKDAQGSFKISFVEIADRTGKKLAVRNESGTVSVVEPKPETSTPRATAQSTAGETPTLKAAAQTTAVRATPRARATTAPRPVASNNTELLTNLVLIVVAGGGCFGALVVAGIGIVILLRRPRRGYSCMPPY